MPGQVELFENFKQRLQSMERHSSSESETRSEGSRHSDESKQQMRKVLTKLLDNEEPPRRTIVDYIEPRRERRNQSPQTSHETSLNATFSPECQKVKFQPRREEKKASIQMH